MCVACGGVATEPAKTPDDIVAEEEQAAIADQRERETADVGGGGGDEELDADKKQKFDVRQSQIELKRAARSAVTCPGSIGAAEKLPSNTAMVTLTFSNDGHVKEATIDEAFSKTKVGTCVLRAMKAVVLPPYAGPEVQVDWEIDFTQAEPAKEKP
jgi:hypothetical protein